jgi:hypothetical protein
VTITNLDSFVIDSLTRGLGVSAVVASIFTLLVFIKSLFDFTRTGPQMTEEVLSHYRLYLAYSLARLVFFAFLISALMAYAGVIVYVAGLILTGTSYLPVAAAGAALAGILLLTARRFVRTLLLSPGVIASSLLYSSTRLLPLWDRLTTVRLRAIDAGLLATLGTWLVASLVVLSLRGAWSGFVLLGGIVALGIVIVHFAVQEREPPPARRNGKGHARPNILMIGADTLRADRLTGTGYHRNLTPNLERLARSATEFTDCYVPCARTAPSIISMLSGTWPHRHRVRDTFVTPDETRLPVPSLPGILKQVGYQSAIVGDWAA